jgi:hypothetical protein
MRVIIVQPPAWLAPSLARAGAIFWIASDPDYDIDVFVASFHAQTSRVWKLDIIPTPSTFQRKIPQQEEVTRELMVIRCSLRGPQGTASVRDCGTVNTLCSQPRCFFRLRGVIHLYILVLSPQSPAVVEHIKKGKGKATTCGATTIHPPTTCIACKSPTSLSSTARITQNTDDSIFKTILYPAAVAHKASVRTSITSLRCMAGIGKIISTPPRHCISCRSRAGLSTMY